MIKIIENYLFQPFSSEHSWTWFKWKELMRPSFAALVGVAHSAEYMDPRILKFNGEMLVGRPLAWSFPNGREQTEEHYNAVTEAYMSVFGFSEEDVHCNHHFVNAAFGGHEKIPSEYKDTKRHVMNELYKGFRGMSEAELRAELDRHRAAGQPRAADERRPKKPTLTLKYEFD